MEPALNVPLRVTAVAPIPGVFDWLRERLEKTAPGLTTRFRFPLVTTKVGPVPGATLEPTTAESSALGVPVMWPVEPSPTWMSRYVPTPSGVGAAFVTVRALPDKLSVPWEM